MKKPTVSPVGFFAAVMKAYIPAVSSTVHAPPCTL